MNSSALPRVLRNVLWMLFSQGGVRLISFLAGTLLARRLGAAEFGTYVFVLTFVSYFGALSDGGLGRYLIRDVARRPDHGRFYLGQITSLRLVLGAVAYPLMVGVALLTGGRAGLVAVAGLSVFFGAVAGPLASWFTAREELRVAALWGLLSSVSTALFVLAAVAVGAGAGGAIVAVTLANIVPTGYLLLTLRRRDERIEPGVSPAFWWGALRGSFPYLLLGVTGLVYFRVDGLMLTWMKGPEANGVYQASYRLMDAATDLPGVVVAALFPTLARLHVESRERLRRAYLRAMGALALLGLPASVLIIALAGPVIRLLYGGGFDGSVIVLRILAVAVFLIFVDTANTMLLYSGDDLGTVLYLSLANTGANVLLNLLLIPRYSYNGAAVATVLSSALSLAIFTPVVLRYLARQQTPAPRAEPASSS